MTEYAFGDLISKSGQELQTILKEKEKELEAAIKNKGRLCAKIQFIQEQIKEENDGLTI